MANIFSRFKKFISDFSTPILKINTVQKESPQSKTPIKQKNRKVKTLKSTSSSPSFGLTKPKKPKTVEEQTKTFYPPEEREEYIPQDDTDFTVDHEIDSPDEEVTEEEMARQRMEDFCARLESNDRVHLSNKYWNMYLDAIENGGEYVVAKEIATYYNWWDMTQGLVYVSEGSPAFIAYENEFYALLYNRAISMTEAINLSEIIESEDTYNL